MFVTLDSSISWIMSLTLSCFSPGMTVEIVYREAFLLSCEGIASNIAVALPDVSIFLRSSS